MEYTTDFTDKDLLNSNGCQAEYCFDIERKRGVGVITVENGEVYVCQNAFDGKECFDKKGFKYSYVLELNNSYESNYYKKIIQKLYKPKSLVGRYLKALVDNAQGTDYKKGEYVKITNDYNANFQVSIGIFGANISEISIWELMPEGFEPNQVCEDCNGEGQVLKAKLYPTGHTEVNETCDKCRGDGFIEKEFVLPENWCCMLTEESASALLKWADISSRLSINGRTYITYQKLWGNSNKDSYIEITFEQFKKYVLKEDTFIDTFNPLAEPSTDKPIHEYEKLRSYIKDETMKSLGISPSYLGYISGVDPCSNIDSLGITALKSGIAGGTPNDFRGLSVFKNHLIPELLNKKSDLEFQEPVIIKSIKNKPKLIIINN